jgi:SPP1 family predicted phage head-tail adaptor
MRSGKLDRKISIDQLDASTIDDYGTPSPSWNALAVLRAEIVQAATDEYIRAYGAADETVIVFRTRYLAGITNADRVTYESQQFNIKEVREIGRRKGLELRCVRLS